MSKGRDSVMISWSATALLAAAAAVTFAPAGLALESDEIVASTADRFAFFTPAGVDPALAEQANAFINAKGLRFTPAEKVGSAQREMTVAVRVDDDVARAVSVRRTLASVGNGASDNLLLSPTRYDLGTARGYQSFAKPQSVEATVGAAAIRLPTSVRDIPMADISQYAPSSSKDSKPSRWGARIALETEQGDVGRTPRTLESLGEQSVDLGGSYRVMKNLDVTAGVRLSQDRDRIAPLTDSAQDAQAVYVGTQFRF